MIEVSTQEKIRARSQVMIALNAGRIQKQPCRICGKFPSEAHHPNYLKPLKVQWVCKLHHAALHPSRRRDGRTRPAPFIVLVTRKQKCAYKALAKLMDKSLGQLIRDLLQAEYAKLNPKTEAA